jgi:hypothetical protein
LSKISLQNAESGVLLPDNDPLTRNYRKNLLSAEVCFLERTTTAVIGRLSARLQPVAATVEYEQESEEGIMSVGNCPECNNVVAQSAKNCTNCGNRNFVVQTDSFVEICNACDGGGRKYSHADAKLIEKDCGQCAGNGYVYQVFNVDCRDAGDMNHYQNLVKKYQQDEGQIFDAINNQVPNETFVDRGGLRWSSKTGQRTPCAPLLIEFQKFFEFFRASVAQ